MKSTISENFSQKTPEEAVFLEMFIKIPNCFQNHPHVRIFSDFKKKGRNLKIFFNDYYLILKVVRGRGYISIRLEKTR